MLTCHSSSPPGWFCPTMLRETPCPLRQGVGVRAVAGTSCQVGWGELNEGLRRDREETAACGGGLPIEGLQLEGLHLGGRLLYRRLR